MSVFINSIVDQEKKRILHIIFHQERLRDNTRINFYSFHKVFNVSDTTIKTSIILPPCIGICGDMHPEIILYCTSRVKSWVLYPVHPNIFTVHPEDLRQIRPTFQTGLLPKLEIIVFIISQVLKHFRNRLQIIA